MRLAVKDLQLEALQTDTNADVAHAHTNPLSLSPSLSLSVLFADTDAIHPASVWVEGRRRLIVPSVPYTLANCML